MKYLKFGPVLTAIALLLACGSDHPRLMGMSVSPSTAAVSMTTPSMGGTMMGSTMMGTITFTAMGSFSNNTTRMLTTADGLTWTSTNSKVATIDMNGMATCISMGTVKIVASVPVNMSMMMGMSMQASSSTMTGSAMLTCM